MNTLLQTGKRKLPLPKGVAERSIAMAFLAVALALATVFGLANSVNIPTYHLDGAFQTASALYRLADGHWPGRDFYPYLGVGVTLVQYPVFLLAGNDVAASVFTAHFAVALSYFAATAVIASLLAPSRRLLAGIVFGSTLVALAVWRPDGIVGLIVGDFSPGNSMRPLRSVLPYLVAACVYLLLRSRLGPMARFGAIGAVAGASTIWSNDFGYPVAAILIVFALWWARSQGVLSLRLAAGMVGAAVVTGFVALTAATMGHPLEMLRYNLFDVGRDQYWYFAPWTAESRILTVGDLAGKLLWDIGLFDDFRWWWWPGPIAVCIMAFRKPTIEYQLLLFIGVALVAGGAVPVLGGHRGLGYQVAFYYWCQVTTIAGGIFLGWRLVSPALQRMRGFRPVAMAVIALILAFQATVAWRSHIKIGGARIAAQMDPNRLYVPELGGYLPIGWSEHVRMARQPPEAYLEEYWGVWSAIARKPALVPVDSVIHALGATRKKFQDAVQALPPVVVSTPRSASRDWHPWGLSANWWFYKPLLENYLPTKTSEASLVWRRTAAVPWPEVPCRVEAGSPSKFSLPDARAGHYDVEILLRRVDTGPRALLMVRNNLNQAPGADGYLSIDRREKRAAFPVLALSDGHNEFDIRVVSAPGDRAEVELAGCNARSIPFDDPEVMSQIHFLAAETPYDLTDRDWLKGVSRGGAAFFVYDHERNRSRFRVGAKVRLADGQVRTIVRQGTTATFLNVFLDGATLDGMRVGYPHRLEIVE